MGQSGMGGVRQLQNGEYDTSSINNVQYPTELEKIFFIEAGWAFQFMSFSWIAPHQKDSCHSLVFIWKYSCCLYACQDSMVTSPSTLDKNKKEKQINKSNAER